MSKKRHAAATRRNRDPILEVLRRLLPAEGTVLEIASGTGEHAVYFAEHLPGIVWQPSDPDPANIESIEAWREEASLPNLRPPLALDVREKPWPVREADALFCANMIHIAPWEASPALFHGASQLLAPGRLLLLYGPFREGERHTAESNRKFDEELRSRDAAWGVRDRFEVEEVAAGEGFVLEELIPMPANNMILAFREREREAPQPARSRPRVRFTSSGAASFPDFSLPLRETALFCPARSR